jgi:hypothetical protein
MHTLSLHDALPIYIVAENEAAAAAQEAELAAELEAATQPDA